jgi:hypothetical protein
MIAALACSPSETKHCKRQTKKTENSYIYIYSERTNDRPGRNAHTKNKYTPVQRARSASHLFIFLLYIKKYKVIDVSDQSLKNNSNNNNVVEIYLVFSRKTERKIHEKKRYMREIDLVHIHI